MAARLSMQASLWIVTLWVARLLVPADYGTMAAGMVFLGFADLLAEAGFGRALIQKSTLERNDIACAFTVSLLLSAVFYMACWGLAPFAGLYLDQPDFTVFLRSLALLVLLVPFRTVSLALLDRDLRLGGQAAIHVVVALIQSGTVLGLALAGFGYWALAAGAFAARILEVGLLGLLAGWTPALAWPTRHQMGLLWFGLHASLGTLLWYFYSKSDVALVGKLGPDVLGWYSLAFQLISMPVEKLTSNANQVAYPVFCRLQDRPDQLRDWYVRLTVLLGFFGLPALAGMGLVAPDAFGLLLGPRWLPAIVPFQILSFVGMVLLYSTTLVPFLNALGRPDVNLRWTATCAAIMPLTFLIGRHIGGLLGICLAWLVCFPLLVSGFFHWTSSLTGITLGRLLRAQLPVFAGVLTMSLAVVGFRWLFFASETEADALRLVGSIAIGVISYAGFMLAFARQSVLQDLKRLLREFRGGSQG
ncbi:MAG: oligosaccharide flippase family protein [Gemmataceae bacterium]